MSIAYEFVSWRAAAFSCVRVEALMLFPDAVQRGAHKGVLRPSSRAMRSGAPLIRDRSTSCPLENRDRPHSEPGTIPGLQRTTPQGLRAALRPGKVQWRCKLICTAIR